MDLEDKLKQLRREREARTHAQKIQTTWETIDEDAGLTVKEKLERLARSRLARECAKLDPACEKAIAEEGMSEELGRWPEY